MTLRSRVASPALRAPFAPVIQVAEGAFVFLGPSPILPQSGGLSQDSRPSKCQG